MKRALLSLAAILMAIIANSQNNAIDELFDKYSGKEGFTTVYISSKMFSMFKSKDQDNQDFNNIINKLKSIRILSVEDSALNKNINFYNELQKKLDFSVYEELMVVKEGNNMTKFLVKENGTNIEELLVITGGIGGNTLISIKGDLDLKSISGLSKAMGIQQLESLDKIDQKPVKK
jgi:Domain of unknown function (DUF4252)